MATKASASVPAPVRALAVQGRDLPDGVQLGRGASRRAGQVAELRGGGAHGSW